MSDGKRDANNVVVMMGVSSVDETTPLPIKIDPDTGRVLCIRAAAATGASKATEESNGKREGNNVVVKMGEVNSSPSYIAPILISENEGNIMIKAN